MNRSLNVVVSLFALLLVSVFTVNKAAADVIRDSTQLENWENLTIPLGHTYTAISKANAPVYLIGNGQKLSRIGLVWGHVGSGGQPNQGDIDTLEWRFMLFNGTSDFASDPHGENRPQGLFHLFEDPSNSNWRDILGTTGGYNMRYAEFDVEFLNLTLTQGANYLASVQPQVVSGGGVGFTLIGFANGGMGMQHDWFKSNVMGPDTLHNLGAPYDYAAWKVTTIPAPGTGLCMALGALACRVRDPYARRKCCPKKVHSTKAIPWP
ncbi:MAG: hypothetical protein QY326_08690 [Bdellovibrionota bacterium]|nr:MAG: hypothetical protein QY326_08690 [Bdellovibrionota bacterium]